ncbi:Kelch repeat-containing protein [Flagellimonas marinaquae]
MSKMYLLCGPFGEQAVLEMTLQPKTPEDYLQLPIGPLNFKEAFTLESTGVEGYSPDLIGSEAEQCLFFATQEDWGEEGKQKYGLDGVLLERVSRIDLTSGEITDIFSPGNFYAIKRMVLHDNRLLVVGACKINSYDLSLQSTPKSSKDYCAYVNHTFSGVSRFGAAASNGKVYVVGGSVHNDMSGVGEDKIYQYDPISDSLEVFGQLPGPISSAAVEIVHGKLYIFDVSTAMGKSPLETSLTIYELDGGSCTKEQLPVTLQQVNVSRKEHLIFMAGVMVSNAQNESASPSRPFVWVYDTRDGTFRTLETNLRNNADNTIHAMTVVGNNMYLLCGKRTVDHYQLQPWRILRVSLG